MARKLSDSDNPTEALDSGKRDSALILTSSPDIEIIDNHGSTVSFEKILEDLGCFGPFQILTLVTYSTLEIACAFVVFIPIFAQRTIIPGNCTNQAINQIDNTFHYSNLSYKKDLPISILSPSADTDPVLESPFEYESVVEEWDLKCDKAWIPDAFTSCLVVGMIIGSILVGPVSDWYGRRQAYLTSVVIMCVGTLASAFSPNVCVYAITRLVTGAGFCGSLNVSTMAVMEFMTPKWRSLANCMGPIGEGTIILSLVAYFVSSWRMLYLATLAPYILLILIYIYLPESPRWLLRNKKTLEAHKVLNLMAQMNGRAPLSIQVLEALRKQEELAFSSQQSQKIGYIQFLRTRELLMKSLYLFAIWFAWHVGFYGISYNINNVPGNRYINVGLIGFASATGQKASMPASDRLGRRKAVLFGMTLSAIFLVALATTFLITNDVSHIWILCACTIGLFGLACTRGSARLLSGETFPTSVRVMGLGIGGLGANIAGLITPHVAHLGSIFPTFPFFIFAFVSVLGSLVVFLMKETTGNPLLDEVQSSQDKHKSNRESQF